MNTDDPTSDREVEKALERGRRLTDPSEDAITVNLTYSSAKASIGRVARFQAKTADADEVEKLLADIQQFVLEATAEQG